MDAILSEVRQLGGLADASLGELEFHLRHALSGELELSLHVLHGGGIVAVGRGGAASRWSVGERIGGLGGAVIPEGNAAIMLGILLFVELRHEFVEHVVLFRSGVGLGLLQGVSEFACVSVCKHVRVTFGDSRGSLLASLEVVRGSGKAAGVRFISTCVSTCQ